MYGEALAVKGFVQVITHQTVDASGGATQVFFGSFHGTAVGLTTGTLYTAVNVQLDNQAHFSADGATESTDVFDILFVSRDGSENFLFHLNHHNTINANGDLTVAQINSHIECTG